MKYLALLLCLASAAIAADKSAEWDTALKSIVTYEQGRSHAGLIAVENLVRAALPNAADRAALERRLTALLGSGATVECKRFVCRQLAIIGSDASVPTLGALLTDPELSDMARFALEPIPGPAVDKALLAALPKTTGKLKIGVISSLGARRTEAAVAPLARLVSGPDEAVARAAVSTIGKIPTVGALDVLRQAYSSVPASLQQHIADGAMSIAQAVLARGDKQPAEQAFLAFYKSSQPQTVRAAALQGLLAVNSERHFPLVLTILRSEADSLQSLAADILRKAPGKDVTRKVVADLPKMPSHVQALVLMALAERGDRAALPVALSFIASADDTVSASACAAVGALGSADQVGLLVDLLDNPGRAGAARDALIKLRGAGVDAVIVQSLGSRTPKVQREVIRILVARNAVSEMPALLRMAASPPSDNQAAVFQALGELAGDSHLPALVKLTAQLHDPAACEAAEQALTSAVLRLGDSSRWSSMMLAEYPKAGVPNRCALLSVLKFSGDPQALALVRDELKSGDKAVNEAAFRAMADWPNADPANDLLQMTREGTNMTRRLLAFRGAVRMGGLTAAAPAGPGLKLLRSAMDAAPRVEDKRLVLGALMAVPKTEALQMAQDCLGDPKLVNEASVAVLRIADAIGKRQPEVARKAVGQVLAVTKNDKVRKQAQALLGKLGSPAR